jgi:uncharacterized protein YegL
MTGTVQLIVSTTPVDRKIMSRMQPSSPSVAVVYADAFGNLTSLQDWRPLSRSQQWMSKLTTRYEVDLSDHRRTARLESSPLPSRGDAYFFQSTVDVGFRVADPATVVRRNVTDALTVVYGYLTDEFRPVTRRYEIQDADRAEAEINQMFWQPRRLEEGIEIYLCRTRLLPDPAAQGHLRALQEAQRAGTLGAAQHEVAVVGSFQGQQLADMAQQARLAAEARERQALAGEPVDVRSLLREHLARHPDQTEYAVELLERHEQALLAKQDIDDNRSIELIRYMMDQELIQAADVEALRSQVLGRVQHIAAPTAAQLPSASWDEPLPVTSEPVVLVSSRAAPADTDPGSARPAADPAVAIPVYLMIDESAGDQGYIAALNTALGELPAELAAYPEVIRAVRLSVLGYAGDVALRMPLSLITTGTFVPRLATRAGSRLGPVFEYLQHRIPGDVQQLKSQPPRVGRPILHILCAAPPGDEPAWEIPFRQLLDRGTFPYAPNVVACGAGAAPADVIRRIAPPPAEGWMAGPGLPLADAARRYISYVRDSIISVSRAHISGSADLLVGAPDGFDAVGDPQ